MTSLEGAAIRFECASRITSGSTVEGALQARRLLTVLAVGTSAWCGARAAGEPPLQQLPAPHYSFAIDSPSASSGAVLADAILQLGMDVPVVNTSGAQLGLGGLQDDLDALSTANSGMTPAVNFALLFSVDPQTMGVHMPWSALVAEGVPHNAKNQAQLGHQAADQYMSLALFRRYSDPVIEFVDNNVLVRNNYNEGGTDFAACPNVAACAPNNEGAQDEVDATARLTTGFIFFSATAMSSSLAEMSILNQITGAHIFAIDTDAGALTLWVYASAEDLGLQEFDDIDALVVFDANNDGSFNGTDQVLFSLTPDSPSLDVISGASVVGAAADVFTVSPAMPPAVFAPASLLGLGHPDDNIDALDYVLCDDAFECAVTYGIRAPGNGFFEDGPQGMSSEPSDSIPPAEVINPEPPTFGDPNRNPDADWRR